MPKKVRTAKGKVIDFDLLRIKQQMVNGPKPDNVQARQDFIDQKLRRRVKRVKSKLEEAKKNREKQTVDVKNDPKVKSSPQGDKIDEAKTPSTKKRKIKRKTINK